jgi:hypothetical protein
MVKDGVRRNARAPERTSCKKSVSQATRYFYNTGAAGVGLLCAAACVGWMEQNVVWPRLTRSAPNWFGS